MTTTETDTSTEVLTIDEAAAILRISRNAAYAAACQWRATGGEHGLPCIGIGRTLRVPVPTSTAFSGDLRDAHGGG